MNKQSIFSSAIVFGESSWENENADSGDSQKADTENDVEISDQAVNEEEAADSGDSQKADTENDVEISDQAVNEEEANTAPFRHYGGSVRTVDGETTGNTKKQAKRQSIDKKTSEGANGKKRKHETTSTAEHDALEPPSKRTPGTKADERSVQTVDEETTGTTKKQAKRQSIDKKTSEGAIGKKRKHEADSTPEHDALEPPSKRTPRTKADENVSDSIDAVVLDNEEEVGQKATSRPKRASAKQNWKQLNDSDSDDVVILDGEGGDLDGDGEESETPAEKPKRKQRVVVGNQPKRQHKKKQNQIRCRSVVRPRVSGSNRRKTTMIVMM